MTDSSPVSFTANFSLPVGTDWNAFQLSPLNVTVDFPSVFLAKLPQPFHRELFRDGILSGSISVSETLQHPCIVGDVQLVNGKFSGERWTPFNFVEASGRIAFEGNRASVEFFNAETKDVDVSVRAEIDFDNVKDLTVRITGATPMFDLTSHQIDCVKNIKVVPTVLTLAPAVAEFEFRGGLFESGWKVSLREGTGFESLAMSDPDDAPREFRLCPGTGPEDKTLVLGALPRTQAVGEAVPSKRQDSR